MPTPDPAAHTAHPAGLSEPEHRAIRAIADHRALAKIQRKLETWELDHLREHAAQLATQVEQLQGQLQMLQGRLDYAETVADYWREQVMNLHADLAGDASLGITADGALGIVSTQHALGGTA